MAAADKSAKLSELTLGIDTSVMAMPGMPLFCIGMFGTVKFGARAYGYGY